VPIALHVIEFKSGQITSLAARAHLGLHGNDAFIEDSTALGRTARSRGSLRSAPERFMASMSHWIDRPNGGVRQPPEEARARGRGHRVQGRVIAPT
jgi:hypothetical protein